MYGNSTTEEINSIDTAATETNYAECITRAFEGSDVEVEFVDNAPTYMTAGTIEDMDGFDIQQTLEEIWDRGEFWRYK